MQYDIAFTNDDDVRVTLMESLKLSEGQLPHLGRPDAPSRFDLLPEMQALVREFLSGFVADRDGLRQQSPFPDCQRRQSLRQSSP